MTGAMGQLWFCNAVGQKLCLLHPSMHSYQCGLGTFQNSLSSQLCSIITWAQAQKLDVFRLLPEVFSLLYWDNCLQQVLTLISQQRTITFRNSVLWKCIFPKGNIVAKIPLHHNENNLFQFHFLEFKSRHSFFQKRIFTSLCKIKKPNEVNHPSKQITVFPISPPLVAQRITRSFEITKAFTCMVSAY